MAAEQKTTRPELGVPFKRGPFAAIMEKMMSHCVNMMPQMMAMCGAMWDGVQNDTEETATDAIRKA